MENIFVSQQIQAIPTATSGTFHNKRSSFSFCQGWSKSSPGFVWWFTPSSCTGGGASSVVFGEDLIQALQRSTVSRDAEVPRSDGFTRDLGRFGREAMAFWRARIKRKQFQNGVFGCHNHILFCSCFNWLNTHDSSNQHYFPCPCDSAYTRTIHLVE